MRTRILTACTVLMMAPLAGVLSGCIDALDDPSAPVDISGSDVLPSAVFQEAPVGLQLVDTLPGDTLLGMLSAGDECDICRVNCPPECDDSGTGTYTVTGRMAVAEIVDVPGTFPQWTGLDPAVSGLPDGAQYSCPAATVSILMISTVRHGTFIISGFLRKVADLPRRNGRPAARYALPPGDHYNFQATYALHGGYVDVTCTGAYLNLGAVGKIWVGTLDAYEYWGTVSPSNRRGELENGGWGYKDTDRGFTNGSSGGGAGGWQAAVRAWEMDGECIPGWKVYVDDVLVCNGRW